MATLVVGQAEGLLMARYGVRGAGPLPQQSNTKPQDVATLFVRDATSDSA
jgi:hypothetical protein